MSGTLKACLTCPDPLLKTPASMVGLERMEEA